MSSIRLAHSLKEYAIHQSIIRYLNFIPGCMAVTYYNGAVFNPRSRGGPRKKGLDRPNGFPDIVGSLNGLAFSIEVKSERGMLNPSQRLLHEKMRYKGWPVAVCRNLKDVDIFLKELSKRRVVTTNNAAPPTLKEP